MKKRLGRLLALAAALPALLALLAFALPGQYQGTYPAALKDKATLLRESEGPRIVLIGGSGTAFGVNCGLLETQFPGYTAVNFGLYADLGTTVMLEMALPDLREGDIAVFSPELSAQTLSDFFGAECMWQASEGDLSLLARLDPSRYGSLLAAFPRYAAGKARLFLTGGAQAGESVYSRAAFTDRGDVEPGRRPANRMPGGWDENMPLKFDPALPAEGFTARVNAFARACGKKGVRVFFRFCPMNASALGEGEEGRIDAFEEGLRAGLECPVLGTARRALMEAGWFYDTNFHLNGAGAALNTAMLAEELRAALGDDTPVTVPLPAMPGGDTEPAPEGGNEDADCFVYAPEEGGFRITDLTAEGKGREELTVPASYQGLPVSAFGREVFAGNGTLRRLTIQSNVRMIPDGAFEGCSGLEAVLLLQEEPARCAVGRELLRGTRADVYVPAARYGAYCTDYFWSVHATRLRPLEEAPCAEAAASPAPDRPAAVTRLRYEGNGGTVRGSGETSLTREVTYAHLRENTLPGTVWFEREGFVLTGWNTRPDGSGTGAGLGSRIEAAAGDTLYAVWLPCSPEEDFDWETDGRSAVITGYRGEGGVCAPPESHGGLPVRRIQSGAFEGAEFSLLVLPPSLRVVEEGAFRDCGTEEMILFDSLESVSDACFEGCRTPETLRINAAVSPVYSGSYFDTFQDKYDRLLSLRGEKKLILSSGSSGRYGYDSELFKKAFPEYEPVNMGVYAFTNALPQLRLILRAAEAGDLLLFAPEFDAVPEQFCVSARLDAGFWAMMESCYDTAAELDMRRFEGVFDSLGEYLAVKARMPARDYAVSPARFDDDGNRYDFATYNRYGDFILPRPPGESDARLRHNIADYTPGSFPRETVQSLNAALEPFALKGVRVFFTYTPRNVNSLTEASTPDARRELDLLLREGLTVPVISDIEESLLPGRYFWLIDSHTGTEGARIHTERVIADLRRALDNEE